MKGATVATKTKQGTKGSIDDLLAMTPEVIDNDVVTELGDSYLDYALSVIVSRALPDARDGLKPVQRRILYAMNEAGLRSDRPHRKSTYAVAGTMRTYHPHGDASIYETLVRLTQDWVLRLPLIDGHGNFGDYDSGAAAARYTEARLAPTAEALLESVDEDTVDMAPNYDQSTVEPLVLPSAFPNLLVNGATGIAVGMATNMAPHNLFETIAATKHRLHHPDCSLDDLLHHLPGPDFPAGGIILGSDGIRQAYETGRGAIRVRAATRIDDISARRKGIIVTELPYNVGPEKVIAAVKNQINNKRLDGISDIKDLTDASTGLNLIIEIKTGFDPDAVLAQLYRLTPLEEAFNVNAVALIDGKPETCTLTMLLDTFIAHRYDVVRRRTSHRLVKANERAHILDGLVAALNAIDDVIHLIRASKDTNSAKTKLMTAIGVSDIQATHILEIPLRRLTSLEVTKVRSELKELRALIADLTGLLASPQRQQAVISTELDAAAARFGTPRRTTILDGAAAAAALAPVARPTKAARTVEPAVALQLADSPCLVAHTTRGGLARVTGDHTTSKGTPWTATAIVPATTRGQVAAVTATGRVVAVSVAELADLDTSVVPRRTDIGGHPASEYVALDGDDRIVGLVPVGAAFAMMTTAGAIKRVTADAWPSTAVLNRAGRDGVSFIALDTDTRLAGAAACDDTRHLIVITSAAQLLRFPANQVRPQGRTAGGMAGIRLDTGDKIVAFGVIPADADGADWRIAATTDAANAKQAAAHDYPVKGRGTSGVRCVTFKKADTAVTAAWVGLGAPIALDGRGDKVTLADVIAKRDSSGDPTGTQVATFADRL